MCVRDCVCVCVRVCDWEWCVCVCACVCRAFSEVHNSNKLSDKNGTQPVCLEHRGEGVSPGPVYAYVIYHCSSFKTTQSITNQNLMYYIS